MLRASVGSFCSLLSSLSEATEAPLAEKIISFLLFREKSRTVLIRVIGSAQRTPKLTFAWLNFFPDLKKESLLCHEI